MPLSHFIEIKVDEEGYAAESGDAYRAAEAAATEYPVVYPEPFANLGCGYGQAGKFVVKTSADLANELGLDWECCNQTDVLLTLFCGSAADYSRFEVELQKRLSIVEKWVKFVLPKRTTPRSRG